MIYFYKNKVGIPWAENYKDSLRKEFDKRNVNYMFVDSVSGLKGTLIIPHIKELRKFQNELKTEQIKTLMQSNGTSANIFESRIDEQQEKRDLNFVDVNLTASKAHEEALKRKFNIENVKAVGFPMHLPTQTNSRKIEGNFVIAGRLTPDKCVFKSIDLALSKGAKKITICYPESSKELTKHYPKSKNIIYKQCTEKQMLDVFSESEAFVNCSLIDTLCVTHIQALAMGLDIYTDKKHSKGAFPYYYDNQEKPHRYDIKKTTTNILNAINDL